MEQILNSDPNGIRAAYEDLKDVSIKRKKPLKPLKKKKTLDKKQILLFHHYAFLSDSDFIERKKLLMFLVAHIRGREQSLVERDIAEAKVAMESFPLDKCDSFGLAIRTIPENQDSRDCVVFESPFRNCSKRRNMMGDRNIVFDKDRAKEVILEKLYPAYEKQDGLYKYVHQKNGSAIQSRVFPKGMEKGSLEHQIWLFFTNLMTYRNSSLVGFRQCVWLYENYPEIFLGNMEVDERELAQILKESGNVHPNANAHRWKGSGETLFENFSGDPRQSSMD